MSGQNLKPETRGQKEAANPSSEMVRTGVRLSAPGLLLGFASFLLICAQDGFDGLATVFPSRLSRIWRISRFEIFVVSASSAVPPIWFLPPRFGFRISGLIG